MVKISAALRLRERKQSLKKLLLLPVKIFRVFAKKACKSFFFAECHLEKGTGIHFAFPPSSSLHPRLNSFTHYKHSKIIKSMHIHNTNTPPRTYTWLAPKLIIKMTLLGLCLFALPFFLNALCGHSLSWGGWVIGFLVGIPLGLVSLSIANKYRKGITVDPKEGKISFGRKSISFSNIESFGAEHYSPWWIKLLSKHYQSYPCIYCRGHFGTLRFRTRSWDQACEISTFVHTL